MTITAGEMLLYAGALLVLFMTPGPVWVALTARALAGGYRAAWPLAFGVMVGDALWPLLATLGVTWIVSVFSGFMSFLRWTAVLIFALMGIALLRHADTPVTADRRLTRPGIWAGFGAGVAVILGNPKAILFYMGVLPGFFDLSRVSAPDIAAIMAISMVVPFVGNLFFAIVIDRARLRLASPKAMRRTNLVAGWLLILVGAVIALA